MKKLIITTIVYLIMATCAFAVEALQIDALWSGITNPTNGKAYSGAIVATYASGTSTAKAVWTNKEKTLPSALGQAQFTLDGNGQAFVFGDGVYKISIFAPTDTGLSNPLITIDGVRYSQSSESALSATYYPDAGADDQGLTGDNNTLKYYKTLVGSDSATFVMRNTSGNATTPYTVTTALTLPANIKLVFENGTYINKVGDFTINNPENLSGMSPLWFGAKFDGDRSDSASFTGTNDRDAWQDCLDSFPVNGGTIRPPCGASILDSGIIWPNDGVNNYQISIIGEHVGGSYGPTYSQTELRLSSKTDTLFGFRGVGGVETLGYSGKLQGLALTGNVSMVGGGSAVGIKFKSIISAVIKDLTIRGFYYGIDMYGHAYYSQIEHITLYNNYTGIHTTTSALFNGVLRQIKTAGHRIPAHNLQTYGIVMDYPGQVTIAECWFEGSKGHALTINNATNINLDNNYFESPLLTTAQVKIGGAERGFSNRVVSARGNIFARSQGHYSMEITGTPVVNISGNRFGAGKESFGYVFALDFTDPYPSGIIAGNIAPDYTNGFVVSGAATANVLTAAPLNRSVGFSTRYPYNDTIITEGSVFFNTDHDKGVFGWQATNPGAGAGATLNSGATTATTTAASATVPVSSIVGLFVGCTIKIVGETFDTGDAYATVKQVGASSVLLDKTADTGVTAASVTYQTSVYHEIMGVNQARSTGATALKVTSGSTETTLNTTTFAAGFFTAPGGSSATGVRIEASLSKSGTAGTGEFKLTFATTPTGTGDTEWVVAPASGTAETRTKITVLLFATGASNTYRIEWVSYESDPTTYATTVLHGVGSITTTDGEPVTVGIKATCSNAGDTITQRLWHIDSL